MDSQPSDGRQKDTPQSSLFFKYIKVYLCFGGIRRGKGQGDNHGAPI